MESINDLIKNFAFTRSQKKQAEMVSGETTGKLPAESQSKSRQARGKRKPPCRRSKHSSMLDPLSFSNSPRPDPISKWVGQQDPRDAPITSQVLSDSPGLVKGLLHIKEADGRLRILVPKAQRERLVKQEHQVLLHVGSRRVLDALEQRYFWPNMKAGYAYMHQLSRLPKGESTPAAAPTGVQGRRGPGIAPTTATVRHRLLRPC